HRGGAHQTHEHHRGGHAKLARSRRAVRGTLLRHELSAVPARSLSGGAPAPVMISVFDLTKRFGSEMVLDGLSLSIDAGETVAIMGPSGTGKTTLLRCLNGLTRPDRGTVRIGPHELRAEDDSSYAKEVFAIRQRVGFVFQQHHLF